MNETECPYCDSKNGCDCDIIIEQQDMENQEFADSMKSEVSK